MIAQLPRLPCGLLLALALWQAAALALAGSYLLAGPLEVLLWLWRNAGLVSRALAVTLGEAALGFLLGNLAAAILALAALLLPRAERVISALALLCFCLPLVATGPILRVLYGPGIGPQVTLAALAVYYTTYLALLVGLRAAPAAWFDLVRSYGRGPGQELLQVRARAALPYLMAGLQIAAPAALLGALVGEFTGAERGLGVLVIRTMRGLDAPGTWALALVAASVSVAAYAGIGALAQRLQIPPALLLSPPRHARQGRPLVTAGLVALAVLALWTLAMEGFGLSPFFAKRPWDVWAFLVTAPDAAAHRATLGAALAETLAFALPGYLAGLLLGAALAAGVVLWPRTAQLLLPAAIALRSIPIVTTAPLLVLALGRGATGTITIVAVMIFFPTLVACLQGMRQTPAQVGELFDSYAASPVRRLIHAQLPAMLPAFFAAARMAVPAALLAATTAEWLATGTGVGALMALTASTSAYGMLWSATVLLALLAALAYLGIERIERAVLARYASEQVT
ncbi:MAG: ABC transporter permease subunit [Cereibacter changlensis]